MIHEQGEGGTEEQLLVEVDGTPGRRASDLLSPYHVISCPVLFRLHFERVEQSTQSTLPFLSSPLLRIDNARRHTYRKASENTEYDVSSEHNLSGIGPAMATSH